MDYNAIYLIWKWIKVIFGAKFKSEWKVLKSYLKISKLIKSETEKKNLI